jgi:streptogramin lyase
MTDFLSALREELLDGLERHERAPRRRRFARPARRATIAVATAAAAVAAAVPLIDGPNDTERSITPDVSRLEGFVSSGFVEYRGSLWATEDMAERVLRIDPQTGRAGARIEVGGVPGGVIAAARALWVLDWQGSLVKVDPRTDRVVGTLSLGQTGGDVAFASGSVWTIGDRAHLNRVDPETMTIEERIELGPRMYGLTCCGTEGSHARAESLAVAGDTLWVAAGTGVTQLDARTGRIVGQARAPSLQDERTRRIAADASGLWISHPDRPELLHIDARTRRTISVRLGGDPVGVGVVDGRVWVGTLHRTGAPTRVTVVDSGQVTATVPVPHAPVQIVPASGGSAWITFGTTAILSPAAVRVAAPP